MSASASQQSLLDQERSKRLQLLLKKAKDFNRKEADDRALYDAIYSREEDILSSKKRKTRGNANTGTNEQLNTFKYSFDTKYKSPEPKTLLEKKAAHMVTALYPNEKSLFRASADNLYSRQKCYVIEKLLNKQIRDINFKDTLYRWVKLGLKQGTAFLQVKWSYETEEVEDIEEIAYLTDLLQQKGGPTSKVGKEIQAALDQLLMEYQIKKVTKQETVIFDGPDVEILSANNVHVDPAATKFKDADYVIVEKYAHLLRLQYLASIGRLDKTNVEILTKKARNRGGFGDKRYQSEGSNTQAIESGEAQASEVNPHIKYYEIWEKGRVSIMTTDWLVLDYRRKLYKDIRYPFVAFVNNPEAQAFYGQSDYKACAPLIEFTDEMQMMMLEQQRRNLEGRVFVQNKNINDLALMNRIARGESGVFPVKDINGIKQDRLPMYDSAVLVGKQELRGQIKDSIGVDNSIGDVNSMGSNARTDGIVGQFTQRGETYTNTSINMLAASLKDLGSLFLKFNREFLTQPEVFAYTYGAAEFYNQTAEIYQVIGADIPIDFDMDINLKVVGDPIEQAEKEEMDQLRQEGAQYPWFRTDRAFVERLSKARGYDNPVNLVDPMLLGMLQSDQQQAESVGSHTTPALFGPVGMMKAQEQGKNQPPQQPQQGALNGPRANAPSQGGPRANLSLPNQKDVATV